MTNDLGLSPASLAELQAVGATILSGEESSVPVEMGGQEAVYTALCGNPECGAEIRPSAQKARFCSDACRTKVYNAKMRPRRKSKLRDLDAEFKAWLDTDDGQTVYIQALRRAMDLHSKGFRHYSIDAICHSIRFDASVQLGPDADGYRLNDHHTSRLARLLMERVPALAGFFEVRRLRP